MSTKIADAQRFIRACGGAISHSTPHLYLSALAFSPERAPIARFVKSFIGLPKIVSGHRSMWSAMQGVIFGHMGCIACASFSSDGKRIVSGSGDNTIRLSAYNYLTNFQNNRMTDDGWFMGQEDDLLFWVPPYLHPIGLFLVTRLAIGGSILDVRLLAHGEKWHSINNVG